MAKKVRKRKATTTTAADVDAWLSADVVEADAADVVADVMSLPKLAKTFGVPVADLAEAPAVSKGKHNAAAVFEWYVAGRLEGFDPDADFAAAKARRAVAIKNRVVAENARQAGETMTLDEICAKRRKMVGHYPSSLKNIPARVLIHIAAEPDNDIAAAMVADEVELLLKQEGEF